MDEIAEEPSNPISLKRQLNHDGEPDTNGGNLEDGDTSPKRAKLSDDSQVTNHKTLPAESALDSAGLNGAIAKPSEGDSAIDTHSQVPPLHRTTANGGGETAVHSGAMQTDGPATTDIESSGVASNADENTRTLCEGVENSSGKKDGTSSEQTDTADSRVQDNIDKEGKQVTTGPENNAVTMETETDTGKGIEESNSPANGPVKQATLQSAKPGEDSSEKVERAEDLSSGKDIIRDRPNTKQPTFSRRKDSRPISLREWTDGASMAEEGEEDEESMDEDEEGMELDPNKLRVTRSRTRKEKGIEDPPPKIYAELSEDSDMDDSPPISPWIDPLSKLTPEQLAQRERSKRLLQEALRIEESKLLFLKKVKQNQAQPVLQPATTNHPPTNLSQNKLETHKSATPTTAQLQQQVIRARTALSKQGFPIGSQLGQHQHQRQPMPLLIRGSLHQGGRPGQTGPPPLMLVPGKQNSHAQVTQNRIQGHQMHRQQASKPHVLQQRQGMHMTNQQVAHQRSSAAAAAQEGQSAASRQAAAKLALRKQLEKTLLQIPPPKPPPPELHFLPSAANSEFIILVGLEEVVNTILKLEEKKDADKENPKFLNPYKCAQCKTDFTTIWKQDPKKGIMCEACIVSNQKRALKAEHTNRLKTAFVKALQQEQEIEQRMQQTHQTKPTQAHVVHQPTRSMYNMSSQQSVPSVRRVLNPPPVANQQPLQQRVPTSYQYIQHLHQGGPVSGQIPMLTKQQINSVYRMPTTDRQREYLLDMIPSKGLGQQPIVWK